MFSRTPWLLDVMAVKAAVVVVVAVVVARVVVGSVVDFANKFCKPSTSHP